MPIGTRSTAAMNSIVIPAVTTPSATQSRNDARVKLARRGRTITSSSTPAQASRRKAAPAGPTASKSATEAAIPSWTVSIEATAIEAPVRAGDPPPVTAVRVGRVVEVVMAP